jgi:hypothetical protein
VEGGKAPDKSGDAPEPKATTPKAPEAEEAVAGSPWADLLKTATSQLIPVVLTAGSLVGFVAFAGSVIVWTRFSAAKVPADQAVNAVPRDELVAIGSSLLLLFGFFGVLAVIAAFLIDRGGRATVGMARGLLFLLMVEGITAVILVPGPSVERTIVAAATFVIPICVILAATYSDLLSRLRDTLPGRGRERLEAELRGDGGGGQRQEGKPASEKAREEERLGEHRPNHLELKPEGMLVGLVATAAAIVAPSLLLHQWWLALSLGAATILVGGLWRIAILSKPNFIWFGLAVFLSVPLFGTLALMARNIVDPQVQPVALIRNTDGPDESLEGLYVTETSDRVYFANIATEGCSNQVTPNSGRLLWVPKDEVVAMSIGPLQNIDDAAKSALEMSYALTPEVETPGGHHIRIGGDSEPTQKVKEAEEKREVTEAELHASLLDQRLDSSGSAVRPNFGAGLSLVPETVRPGGEVELRMSAPNREGGMEGFGKVRGGRTLRLGGTKVNIVKEKARNAEGSEYLKTTGDKLLNLDKEEPYVNRGDEGYVPLEDEPHGKPYPQFVRLIDKSVLEVEGQSLPEEGAYLELAGKGDPPPMLAKKVSIKLRPHPSEGDQSKKKAKTEYLEPRPLGQNWHEDHIKFVVPKEASTGPVTVECEQLAGQPVLQVSEPPSQ